MTNPPAVEYTAAHQSVVPRAREHRVREVSARSRRQPGPTAVVDGRQLVLAETPAAPAYLGVSRPELSDPGWGLHGYLV